MLESYPHFWFIAALDTLPYLNFIVIFNFCLYTARVSAKQLRDSGGLQALRSGLGVLLFHFKFSLAENDSLEKWKRIPSEKNHAFNFNEEPFYMNNTADISDKMQRTVSSE